jgi:hypothetical protein
MERFVLDKSDGVTQKSAIHEVDLVSPRSQLHSSKSLIDQSSTVTANLQEQEDLQCNHSVGCEDDDEVLSQSAESNLFAEMFSHGQDVY